MTGRHAFIVGARRTPVAPRGGALKMLQADELAAPVLKQLLIDTGVPSEKINHVILGNALYGGGNPARMAALRAGFPISVPSLTIDTQCCSGLDSIIMGARLIEAGTADCVLAGGAESFSRAPLRLKRPKDPAEEPEAYHRPPFAPPPFHDPDLAEAAALLAERQEITRKDQAEFASNSHANARNSRSENGKAIVSVGECHADTFTRDLPVKTALRAPVLNGTEATGLSAATIACEADGAAAVMLVSADLLRTLPDVTQERALRVVAAGSAGNDPAEPALAPNSFAQQLLLRSGRSLEKLTVLEVNEAYAVQAMATQAVLGIKDNRLNPLGGALARGHPIGASGAILVVQLYQSNSGSAHADRGDYFSGMALIAAAGGLASALLVESC